MIEIKDCKIKMIVDSREKVFSHITDVWEEKGINYHIFKKDEAMKVGDYSIAVQTNTGEVIDFRNKVAIERKANLNELCGNFTDKRDNNNKTRLIRELERAKKNNIKLLLLIEDEKGYTNALNGYFRKDKVSRMNSNSFIAMLFAYKARYDYEIIFIDKKNSASYIYNYLYYYAREYLKNLEV